MSQEQFPPYLFLPQHTAGNIYIPAQKLCRDIEVIFEQHGFELHGSNYTQTFPIVQYGTANVLIVPYDFLSYIFSSFLDGKNAAYNTCNMQTVCSLTVYVSVVSFWGSQNIQIFDYIGWVLAPLTPSLFKGQL